MTPSGDTTLNAKLNISTSTSHLTLTNGGFSGFLEVPGSTDILRLVRGNCINIGTSGVYIGGNSTRNPVCQIDCGQTASNMILSLFNDTTGGSLYALSANNSALQMSSANSFTWYTNCSNSSPINVNTMTL
jgi:hypothetical protein